MIDMKKIDEKLEEALILINEIYSSLPTDGHNEIDEIKNGLAKIKEIVGSIFSDINKECIEFSRLDHIKQQLTQLAFLVVRLMSLVEFLEYSHSKLCNRLKDKR